MKTSKIALLTLILCFATSAFCFSADLTGIWDVTTEPIGEEPITNRILITQEGDSFVYGGIPGAIRNGKYLIMDPDVERTLVKGVWIEVDKIIFTAADNDNFTGRTYLSVYDFKDSKRKVFSNDMMITGVRVENPPPIMKLNGKPEVWVEVGGSYNDAGAIAFEETGESISDNIVADSTVDTDKVGTYTITYSVTGTHGAADELTRKVHVVAPAPPVLTMKGDAEVSIQKGERYVDAGAKAVNFLNEDISDKIQAQVDGEAMNPDDIDMSKAGKVYEITYTIEDDHGSAQATRTVTVMQREDEQFFFKYCFISILTD